MALVVLTHLDLASLETKTFGIYQRFRMLVDAGRRVDPALTLVSCVRVAPDDSAQAAAARAQRSLAQHWGVDAQVVCVPCADPPDAPWLVQQIMAAAAYRWRPLPRSILHPQAERQLREACAGASLVIAHRLPLMTCLIEAGLPSAPVYFDLDDIEHIALRRHAATHPSARERLFIRLGLPNVYFAMRRALRHARCTFVCSSLDQARLARRHAAAVRVVPNTAPVVEQPAPVPARPVVLTVGVYSFRPNADGADHFIEQVWPAIRRELPDAELWLAGTGAEQLRSHGNPPPGVRFLGFVPDLAAVYAQARLVVCPLRSGGGTRVKLLEAAAHGRPIVSTAVGAEGIGFEDGADALIADPPRAFAAACLAVLRDDALAARLAENARRLVNRAYARPAVVEALAGFIAADLQSQAASPPAG